MNVFLTDVSRTRPSKDSQPTNSRLSANALWPWATLRQVYRPVSSWKRKIKKKQRITEKCSDVFTLALPSHHVESPAVTSPRCAPLTLNSRSPVVVCCPSTRDNRRQTEHPAALQIKRLVQEATSTLFSE